MKNDTLKSTNSSIDVLTDYITKRFVQYGVEIIEKTKTTLSFGFPKFKHHPIVMVIGGGRAWYEVSVDVDIGGKNRHIIYSGKHKTLDDVIYIIHVETAVYEKNSRS